MLDVSEQIPSHGDRVRAQPAAAGRDALIGALAERFHVDEQGTLVNNGLSTDLIVFPSDRLPGNVRHLDNKVEHAMAYATTFKDVDELNALYMMQKTGVEADNYVALGLYLYLADECARLRPDTTLLTELRKEKAGLKWGDRYYEDDLLKGYMRVLKNLGMAESHGPILEEWAQNASYTIHGERNGRIPGSLEVEGAYARLARDISKQNAFVILNLPISYSVGHQLQNIKHNRNRDAAEAYEFTKGLTHETYAGLNPYIAGCIEEGERERKHRVYKSIGEQMGPAAVEESWQTRMQKTQIASEMLGYLPTDMLELLYREGYDIAYANAKNIEKCYPAEQLPGLNAGEKVREDKGVREKQYRAIFVSNGTRKRNGDDIEKDEHLRYKVAAQTLAHEAFHNAVDYLNQDECETLKKAVAAVDAEVLARARHDTLPGYFTEPLKAIDSRTLADVVKYTSIMYNYAKNRVVNKNRIKVLRDVRWLEAACNTYSLMQTEYPPGSGGNDPYRDLPTLGALKEQIDTVMKKALERCREGHPNIEMPEIARRQSF